METEFVNLYIKKLQELVNELLIGRVQLETRVALYEEVINSITSQRDQVQEAYDGLVSRNAELNNQIAEQSVTIANLESQLDSIEWVDDSSERAFEQVEDAIADLVATEVFPADDFEEGEIIEEPAPVKPSRKRK